MHGPTNLFSEHLHATKYRNAGESFQQAMARIAYNLKDSDEHYEHCKDILYNMRFAPAGRIQAAVGSPKQVTPYNCFVSGTIEDKFSGTGSIMDRANEAAITMRLGGGIGYDFSTLRPKGWLIKKLQSQSSGAVSFMDIYNAIGLCISSAGHRRGAQMGVLRIDHPDVEEFVHAKQNVHKLTGFNISLAVTDDFMQCLIKGSPFSLKWEGETVREVDAQALWDTIMRSTWDWAEPGVLFIDTINRKNNLHYCETIAATNPCVPGWIRILTDEGYKRIDSLVGKNTTIWNGHEWSEVQPFSTGINSLMMVQLSNGRLIECTPEHKFILNTGKRIEAKNLQIGQTLMECEFPVVEYGVDYEGDAYSQGFYSGDGTKNQARSWIYKPKHMCIPRLIGNVGKEHATRGFKIWYHGQMKDAWFVPIDGTIEYCLNWLAGLFDADGTAQGNFIQFTTTNHEFAYDVQLLLTRLGIKTNLGTATHKKGYEEHTHPNFIGRERTSYTSYRINITQYNTVKLLHLGMKCERLKLEKKNLEGVFQKPRHLTVSDIFTTGVETETFCFTEPHLHAGVFEGVYLSQCGEQPLPPYGACLLGSFNLTKYIMPGYADYPKGYVFNWAMFERDIPVIVRMMDNIIDRASYPLQQQRMEALKKRRMGLGIMGLANVAEVIGMPYASAEFLDFQLQILETLVQHSYKASIELAVEKGPFPLYDAELYNDGEFIKTLPADIRKDIKKHGIRNSHLTSIAPTGTIAFCHDYISSGIEPVFEYESNRLVNMPEGMINVHVKDYAYDKYGVEGKLSKDVTAQEHVHVLAAASALVDSAVSKTCNVDPRMDWDEFKNLYANAWERDCKGITTFNVQGKRIGIMNAATNKVEVCEINELTGERDCG